MLNEHTLVTVFLRGGADGLALVPAVGDDQYHHLRPRLAVKPGAGERLDDRFALAPELAALAPFWRDGRLAVVQDAASSDESRSHFYAQPLLERGSAGAVGGWVARYVQARGSGGLTALAFADALPESLRGAAAATALRSLDDLDPGPRVAALGGRLAALYADDPLLGGPAADTRAAMDKLRQLRHSTYRPEHGARYGDDAFARDLAQTAHLIKAGVGIPAVCLDLDGWDSHVAQEQFLGPSLRALGNGLAAFANDLGPALARTSIVVYSEFGRRVAENSALGTDHGHGFALLVLGGGTPGGLHVDWAGLADHDLLGPGDLPGNIDYRAALAAVVARHGVAPVAVFPDFNGTPLAL